jgi:DNA-directed RNA polymerase subunit RPC12/RpoP
MFNCVTCSIIMDSVRSVYVYLRNAVMTMPTEHDVTGSCYKCGAVIKVGDHLGSLPIKCPVCGSLNLV